MKLSEVIFIGLFVGVHMANLAISILNSYKLGRIIGMLNNDKKDEPD